MSYYTFIKYVGGKFKMLDKLLPLFPLHKNYTEPFCGSCVVLLNKPKSQLECVNDKNKDIWNLFNVVKNRCEEFKEAFKYSLNSRYQFYLYREQNPEELDELQRAVRFYYIIKNCYAGKLLSPSFTAQVTSPEGINYDKLFDVIDRVYDRIKKVRIENLEYDECIKRYDSNETFFFIDPPYYGENHSKGVNHQYIYNFEKKDFSKLNDVLHTIKGNFLMTINNHEYIRDMYKDFNQSILNTIYSMRSMSLSNGTSKSKNMNVDQLIISNYDIKPKRWKLK